MYAWNRNGLAFWAAELTKCFAFVCKTSTIRKVSHIGSIFYVDQFDFPRRWLPGYENKQSNKNKKKMLYLHKLIIMWHVLTYGVQCKYFYSYTVNTEMAIFFTDLFLNLNNLLFFHCGAWKEYAIGRNVARLYLYSLLGSL